MQVPEVPVLQRSVAELPAVATATPLLLLLERYASLLLSRAPLLSTNAICICLSCMFARRARFLADRFLLPPFYRS